MSGILEGNDPYTQPSFSRANRLGRLVWGLVRLVAFRFSPRPLHAWRAFVLRCFGAKLGRGCHIYPGVKIWAPWNLECGDYVGIADGVTLYNQDRIAIGSRATISQGSHLCTGTHDYTRPHFPLRTAPIAVGDCAWICAEVFIHPGVRVGEGTVVGARAVVTADLPAWTVCAGHPCRVLKLRPRWE
ncbi:WcaF family extracellular polysaccharide biosynthesis acetyltransferase [Gloeobacter kilaueensis]|uniref:Colanic acid biosynthesis acetyltransferase WcaF n=1 Tax=Gloeobacter kilaueensis (strain ATCC BAA-2537 / CCAP 1431/1 / ULC 316 / JS1) TaxID=1183438 RepID=U5QHK3_GLOK1|nr:WcaF family extracellular polysaccharide biosynthesis acetyltransferase [Gloeobacter kilaueensis]AGY58401.1 colanic acid biosynthesis acetyltransferase WcaF [Gloeobacter kilaueensis JS1]